MKTVLMYFLLVILIILLLLPPALRIFMPKEVDLDEIEEGKNILTITTCSRGENEDITFTYNNKKIQKIFYRVPGDKSYNTEGENIENETNDVVKSLFKYGAPFYDDGNDITSFNVIFTTLEYNDESLKNYSLSVSQQKAYMEKLDFVCSIMEMDA